MEQENLTASTLKRSFNLDDPSLRMIMCSNDNYSLEEIRSMAISLGLPESTPTFVDALHKLIDRERSSLTGFLATMNEYVDPPDWLQDICHKQQFRVQRLTLYQKLLNRSSSSLRVVRTRLAAEEEKLAEIVKQMDRLYEVPASLEKEHDCILGRINQLKEREATLKTCYKGTVNENINALKIETAFRSDSVSSKSSKSPKSKMSNMDSSHHSSGSSLNIFEEKSPRKSSFIEDFKDRIKEKRKSMDGFLSLRKPKQDKFDVDNASLPRSSSHGNIGTQTYARSGPPSPLSRSGSAESLKNRVRKVITSLKEAKEAESSINSGASVNGEPTVDKADKANKKSIGKSFVGLRRKVRSDPDLPKARGVKEDELDALTIQIASHALVPPLVRWLGNCPQSALSFLDACAIDDCVDDIVSALLYLLPQQKAFEVIQAAIHNEVLYVDGETIFRGNSPRIKLIKEFCEIVGFEYRALALGAPMQRAMNMKCTFSCEVNPIKINNNNDNESDKEPENIRANQKHLMDLCRDFLEAIFNSIESAPRALCMIIYLINSEIKKEDCKKNINIHSTETETKRPQDNLACSFLFLRFFCPSLIVPDQFGLCSTPLNYEQRRNLMYVAKVLQNVGSGVYFGSKEPYMIPLNGFLDEFIDRTASFYNNFAKDCIIELPSNYSNVSMDPRMQREMTVLLNAVRMHQGRLVEGIYHERLLSASVPMTKPKNSVLEKIIRLYNATSDFTNEVLSGDGDDRQRFDIGTISPDDVWRLPEEWYLTVSSGILAQTSENMRKKMEFIYHVLLTELRFVVDLRFIRDVLIEPLDILLPRSPPDNCSENAGTYSDLFSNMLDLLPIHSTFVQRLQALYDPTTGFFSSIGCFLSDMIELLKPYKFFVECRPARLLAVDRIAVSDDSSLAPGRLHVEAASALPRSQLREFMTFCLLPEQRLMFYYMEFSRFSRLDDLEESEKNYSIDLTSSVLSLLSMFNAPLNST